MVKKIPLPRTIPVKLALIFILTQLPVYYSGVLIHNWGINVVRRNVIERDLANLRYHLDSMEEAVERVRSLQSSFISGPMLNIYTNMHHHMSVYYRGVYLNRIRETLFMIQNSSQFLENVIVFIPRLNMRIEATGGRQTAMTEADIIAARTISTSVPSNMRTAESALYLNMTWPPLFIGRDDPTYAVMTVFSILEIQRSLEHLGNSDSSLFLLTDDGMVIASVGGEFSEFPVSKDSAGYTVFEHNDINHLMTYVRSPFFAYRLVHIVPEDTLFGDLNKYRYQIWAFTSVVAVIAAIFLYTIYNMLSGIDRIVQEAYEQKLMLKNSELNQLQAQINPHFINNSYFLLHRMIKSGDKDKAVMFSKQMGVYFKYITGDIGTMTPLFREIEHARIYAGIQAVRFEGRIEVRFGECPEDCGHLYAPRLILQPVLENAFEHAFKDTLEGGLLTINFSSSEKGLRIFVEDNEKTLSDYDIEELNKFIHSGDVSREDSIGLINIHRRLVLAFGAEGYLQLSRSDLGGLKVEISVGGDVIV